MDSKLGSLDWESNVLTVCHSTLCNNAIMHKIFIHKKWTAVVRSHFFTEVTVFLLQNTESFVFEFSENLVCFYLFFYQLAEKILNIINIQLASHYAMHKTTRFCDLMLLASH